MSRSGSSNQVSAVTSGKLSLYGKQAAREILVLAATANLSAEAREQISSLLGGTIDWKYLLELAEYHGISPLISHHLLNNNFTGRIPLAYAEKLKNIYNNSLYKNMVFSDENIKVISAFNERDIPVIVLKGITLAELLYNNPGLRTMSDIDIMVPPDMIANAKSLLTESGYQPHTTKKPWEHPYHEVPYFKGARFPVFIELHRNLEDPRLVNIPLQEVWKRAQEHRIQQIPLRMLSPEDTLLYLCNGFTKPSNFILKSLCDIAELLKKYEKVLDWDYIINSARSWQMQSNLVYTLTMARSLLGAPVPDAVLKMFKPGFWRKLSRQILIDQETFISPIKSYKLRAETLVLHNSLMMDLPGKTFAVLIRFRGHYSRIPWLRTAVWVSIVYVAALIRNLLRLGQRKSRIPAGYGL